MWIRCQKSEIPFKSIASDKTFYEYFTAAWVSHLNKLHDRYLEYGRKRLLYVFLEYIKR